MIISLSLKAELDSGLQNRFSYLPQRFASCNVIIIPELCGEGTYRNVAMTSCETCDAGLTPNPVKTACGKIIFIIAMLNLIVL